MRMKALLLGSVSLSAIGTGASVSTVQAAGPGTFTYSLEGAWLSGANTAAEDKLGGPTGCYSGGTSGYYSSYCNDIQANTGYRAALTVGTVIDEHWDARAGVAVNQGLTSTSYSSGYYSYSSGSGGSGGTFYSGYYNERLTTNFSYQTLDFEVGYTPTLDDKFQLRFFAGLRGLHYTDSLDKMGTGYSGGYTSGFHFTHNEEFLGVGPRVGVEGSARFGESPFGVSGMLSAAAIHGLSNVHETAQFTSGGLSSPIYTNDRSEWKTVFDLEAALGVDYYLTDTSKFTVGVRAEQITNIGISGGATAMNTGVFVKLSGSL
jgi:hypothetical protein